MAGIVSYGGYVPWHRLNRMLIFKAMGWLNAGTRGLAKGEKAVAKLLDEMQRRGIATYLGKKINGFNSQGVDTEGGHIPAELILFMPGLTGPEWVKDSGLPLSEGGFIRGDE